MIGGLAARTVPPLTLTRISNSWTVSLNELVSDAKQMMVKWLTI